MDCTLDCYCLTKSCKNIDLSIYWLLWFSKLNASVVQGRIPADKFGTLLRWADLGQFCLLFVDRIVGMFLPLFSHYLFQLRQPQGRVFNLKFWQSDAFEVLERGPHPFLRVSVNFWGAVMEPKTQRKYVITSLELLLSVVLGELQVHSLTNQFDSATKELKI